MQVSQTNTEGTAWCLAPETAPRDPPPRTQPLPLFCHHCLCSPRPPTVLPDKDIGLQGVRVHIGDSHQHVPKSGASNFCNFLWREEPKLGKARNCLG